MGDDMKLPTFKGTWVEDPEQHWFLCEAIWTIKQIQDDNTNLSSWPLHLEKEL